MHPALCSMWLACNADPPRASAVLISFPPYYKQQAGSMMWSFDLCLSRISP